MGNNIGAERKGAKVMQLNGTTFRVKPPAAAADLLGDHPGFQLLESEEVKLLGARACPLVRDAPLCRGKLYFLASRSRGGGRAGPLRRAWSGNLRVGARERLDSARLNFPELRRGCAHHGPPLHPSIDVKLHAIAGGGGLGERPGEEKTG